VGTINPLVYTVFNLEKGLRIWNIVNGHGQLITVRTRASATLGNGLYMSGNLTPSSLRVLNHTSLIASWMIGCQ
jgi:hypothetical protein